MFHGQRFFWPQETLVKAALNPKEIYASYYCHDFFLKNILKTVNVTHEDLAKEKAKWKELGGREVSNEPVVKGHYVCRLTYDPDNRRFVLRKEGQKCPG
jgi:hypothetical protein